MKLLDSSHKMQEAHAKQDDSWVREALACPANPGQSSTAHVGCQPSLSAHQPCTSGAELRLHQKHQENEKDEHGKGGLPRLVFRTTERIF